MNEQQALMEKREEARQEILALAEKTPPAVILKTVSSWFPKSISERTLYYWILQIVLIHTVYILPSFLLAWIFGETKEWASDIREWLAAVELAIYAFFLAYNLYQLIYTGIADHVVKRIAYLENIKSLVSLFETSILGMYSSIIIGAILWSVWTYFVKPDYRIIGLMYAVIFTGCLIGIAFQAVFWAMGLAMQLKGFHYELNTFTPANSDVVSRLSTVLNRVIYITGAYFVILTLMVSLGFFGALVNKVFALPLTFLGWGTMLIQFIIHRSTLNTIIENERWTSLNKLQVQMNNIQANGDLSNKDVSERLLRLADLHERIHSNRSGGFDIKSALSLFSQLMLPLLGLLLGNIDKVMAFFK